MKAPIASRTSLFLRALLIITTLLLGAAAVFGLVRTIQANRGPVEIVNTNSPSPIATPVSTPANGVMPLPKLTPTNIPSGNEENEDESNEDEAENNEEEDD